MSPRLPSLPLTLLLLLLTAGCGPRDLVATLEQRPAGTVDEVLVWTAHGAGAHAFDVSIDIDEAKLMGWARTDVSLRALLDVSLEGPGTEPLRKVLTVPITERRQVGEDKSRNTVQVAYLAAGELQETGFRRVPAQRAFRVSADGGDWTLRVRLRVPHGGNKRAIHAIRTVRVEVQGTAGRGLTAWTAQPPEAFQEP